ERIIVELREKVGVTLPERAISVMRSDDPRTIAREGLIGLGYSSQEADALLDGLGDAASSPEELISEALRAARR
ncbi:MAG: Holliday junction branch migration protein RuvA, partial [Acidobacteriota bacterium]|nr:Holliday junction branch migration protein RuvA [Acidobacteriota bacterium]